jgi:hypothetical protein
MVRSRYRSAAALSASTPEAMLAQDHRSDFSAGQATDH